VYEQLSVSFRWLGKVELVNWKKELRNIIREM